MKKFLSLTILGFAVFAHAGINKSAWPRVAPVIFVHGVGSSPATWDIDQVRDNVPTNLPMWPSGDDSKTGDYSYHKGEYSLRDNAVSNTPDVPYFFKNLNNNTYIGGNGAIQTDPFPFWVNAWNFPKNTQFGVSESNLKMPYTSLAMNYDLLQAKTTRKSRFTQNGIVSSTFNFDSFGNLLAPVYPVVDKRENGIEMYDAFWGMGWPDGKVPSKLKGVDGMLYGTYIASPDQNWVKAKYSRRTYVNNYPQQGTTKTTWKTYTKPDWDLLNVTASDPNGTPPKPSSAIQIEILGSFYGPGGLGNGSLNYSVTNVVDAVNKKRTIIHTWYTFVVQSKLAWQIIYTIEDNGYTGDQLAEETPYGQIGQLYITIKKTLDKYYRDGSTGQPNWYLGNGNSDPGAKVVLVGHSQGGVLSRGVCYPGFGAQDQYDPDLGYMPMYFPKAMANQAFTGIDGSIQNMSGQYFDVRNHIAGVVTTSSPNYGAPIGYRIEGLYQMHQGMIADKNLNPPKGPYNNIFASGIASIDDKAVSAVRTQLDGFLDIYDPSSPTSTTLSEKFDGTVLDNLRKLDVDDYKTTETMNPPIKDVATGNYYAMLTDGGTSNGQVAPSSPCEISAVANVGSNGLVVNHYRLYWQPEYDNWVRSYRFDEADNGTNETYKSLGDGDKFRKFGRILCEEQIGRSTRITDPYNPNYKAPPKVGNSYSYTDYPDYNPLIGEAAVLPSASTALAKSAASTTQVKNSIAQSDMDRTTTEFKAFLSCVEDAAADATNLSRPGLFGSIVSLAIPPFVNPYLYATGIPAYFDYRTASGCYDRMKFRLNNNIQSLLRGIMANGAQGLAYHPASTFLHRLNQKGGPSDSKPDSRRPYPSRADGTPIPFISIVNTLNPSTNDIPSGAQVNSDMVVNSLSQDLGFGYPDVSKSGSLVKLALVGYAHTMTSNMNNNPFGPWLNSDLTRNINLNYAQHEIDRNKISNLILGLAIGQSPVLLNQGSAAAKVSDIESNYTYSDASGYKLQSKIEGVQGKYSRLKGLNPDEIFEPIPLPLNDNRDAFLVNSAITINNNEELFIPSGSKVIFGSSGSITIMSGGRLTLGGVPVYSSASPTNYGITFVASGTTLPSFNFKSGSKFKFPDLGVNKMKFKLFIQMNGTNYPYIVTPNKLGNKLNLGPNHMYQAFDISPFYEDVVNGDKVFNDAFLNWSAVQAATSILFQ